MNDFTWPDALIDVTEGRAWITAVRAAYLAALPWGTEDERLKAFDAAMILAPIKTAHEGRSFAAARGWQNGIPFQAAMLLSRTLRRCEVGHEV